MYIYSRNLNNLYMEKLYVFIGIVFFAILGDFFTIANIEKYGVWTVAVAIALFYIVEFIMKTQFIYRTQIIWGFWAMHVTCGILLYLYGCYFGYINGIFWPSHCPDDGENWNVLWILLVVRLTVLQYLHYKIYKHKLKSI